MADSLPSIMTTPVIPGPPPIAKRRGVTVGEKLRVIRELESGVRYSDVVKKYNMSKSTVFTIWKTRDSIRAASKCNSLNRKKIKKSQKDDLDQALYCWYKIQESAGLPSNGPLLKVQADRFAKHLGYSNFKCSNGWIDRFKNRHNIFYSRSKANKENFNEKKDDNSDNSNWNASNENIPNNPTGTDLFFNINQDNHVDEINSNTFQHKQENFDQNEPEFQDVKHVENVCYNQEGHNTPQDKQEKSSDHPSINYDNEICDENEAVRDEFSIYGEHVANKLRNCERTRLEIAIAQRQIDEICFKLTMGGFAPLANLNSYTQTIRTLNSESTETSTRSTNTELALFSTFPSNFSEFDTNLKSCNE